MFRKRHHYGQVRVTQGASRGGHHQNLQSLESQGTETGWHEESGGTPPEGFGQGSDRMS